MKLEILLKKLKWCSMMNKSSDFEKLTGFKTPEDYAEYASKMMSIKVAEELANAIYKYNCKGKRKLIEELLKDSEQE